MKKLIITLLIFAAPAVMFAQLIVRSNGCTTIGCGSLFAGDARLEVGKTGTGGGVGVFSRAYCSSSSSGEACGVFGLAEGAPNGYNYGVMGIIDDIHNGAGIVGTASNDFEDLGINGKYAGFFLGNTNVTGTLTATSVTSPSDIRLKRDITPLRESTGDILNKVLGMNVVEYSYKSMIPSLILPDTVSVEKIMRSNRIPIDKKHIGLIAQELQEIFPSLVEVGQDGYLSINYIELVPVLIQAIQELKQELDDVKGAGSGTVRKAAIATGMADATTIGNVLYQNTPNPFKEQTTIRFHLADDAQNAAICIFDMTGKMLKKLPVSQGMESVSIAGYELGEGMFLYTLMVNGQEIDTKRMIITK